jgi:hypothetical protein
MPVPLRTTFAPLLLGLILAAPQPTHAQTWGDYDLTWYTIDSGAGALTGGDYTLTGSIGQPDAGQPLTGGDYDLTGGFVPGKTAVPGAAVNEWQLY